MPVKPSPSNLIPITMNDLRTTISTNNKAAKKAFLIALKNALNFAEGAGYKRGDCAYDELCVAIDTAKDDFEVGQTSNN